MKKIIKTAHLEIKPYDDSDQADMIEILTNIDIKRSFMIPDFETETDAINMFKKLQEYSYLDTHFERGIYLNAQLIGFVNDVEIEGSVIELGYVIHPAFSCKGFATEVLKSVIDELFQNGFTQIVTGAFDDNVASIRVMNKCGMKKIPREENISYRGIMHHCVYYAVFSDR